ncbi:MAG: hypothetical protein AB7G11_03920 [Phycisphaerales bacterium]
MFRYWLGFAPLALWLGVAIQTSADVICCELPYESYGHLRNNGKACAATSIVNSFSFLAREHPEVYNGTRLFQGTPAQTRDLLNGGWGDRRDARHGTQGCQGERRGDQDMWESKTQWLIDFAPGTTRVSGTMGDRQNFSNWANNAGLQSGNPHVSWLYDAICARCDVEITYVFGTTDQSFSHAVTLTKVCFDDRNNNGRPEDNEAAQIGVIDPNNPGSVMMASVTWDARKQWLKFEGGAHIRSAMAENIPAPSAAVPMTLLAVGGRRRPRRVTPIARHDR